MALRMAQLVLVLLGFVLLLQYGIIRHPAWFTGGDQPVHWRVVPVPFACGILCILFAVSLIWARLRR